MKNVLGYIMALMVLAFSMLPCADEGAVTEGKAGVELAQTMPQNDPGDHNDACSPFCICSCCSGFSVTARMPVAFTVSSFFQTAFTSYIGDRLYTVALPIWQPPRLV